MTKSPMAPFTSLRKSAQKITSNFKHSSLSSTSSSSTPARSAKSIERQTGRKLTLETEPTIGNLAKCHSQHQSPLYQLPPELRDMIFDLATRPSNDPSTLYDPSSPCYRPGHEAKHKHCTAMLRTCRRAWVELNALPLKDAEHAFWLKDVAGTRPPWCRRVESSEEVRLQKFLARLTPLGRRRLQHLRFFAHTDSSWLEAGTSGMVKAIGLLYGNPPDSVAESASSPAGACFVPKVFTLTIRACDWPRVPCHRSEADVKIEARWLGFLVRSLSGIGVGEFRLEMEVEMGMSESGDERRELDELVERVRRWYAPMERLGDKRDGEKGSGDEGGMGVGLKLRLLDEMEESTWTRPGQEADGKRRAKSVDIRYRAVTLIWKSGDAKSSARKLPAATMETRRVAHKRPELMNGHVAQYEQRWRREGSLLKFDTEAHGKKL